MIDESIAKILLTTVEILEHEKFSHFNPGRTKVSWTWGDLLSCYIRCLVQKSTYAEGASEIANN